MGEKRLFPSFLQSFTFLRTVIMCPFSLLFSVFKKTKIPLRFPHRLYFTDLWVLLLLSELFPVQLLESFELLAVYTRTGENGHGVHVWEIMEKYLLCIWIDNGRVEDRFYFLWDLTKCEFSVGPWEKITTSTRKTDAREERFFKHSWTS